MRKKIASLAFTGVIAGLASQDNAHAECQNPEGFPVLSQVDRPEQYVRFIDEDLRNQYNLEIRGLILNPQCTDDPNKMGLLVANLDRLHHQSIPESEYNHAYLFTNCDDESGLNNITTPEEDGQPGIDQQCFYDGEDYCSSLVLLDRWTNEAGTRRNFTAMQFENEGYMFGPAHFGINIPEEIPPIAILTSETYEDFGNGQVVRYQVASFNRNGRAMLQYELNGEPRTTTNQMTSGLLATEPFRAIEFNREGGGVYLMGLHNTFRTPHVITVELDLSTNTFEVCGNIVNPVVDTYGNPVNTVDYKIIPRTVTDIYGQTRTVGFVLNPDSEAPNGFKLFSTVDLNSCNFTGCAPEETCRENTGICEPTEVNTNPCEGVVCETGEVCIEGACAPDEEADAGDTDLPETGLDTDTETDADMGAADATDDTDLEEDPDADMADEPDAQPDIPEEDVANSDTGDGDAEDPYHPDNNGNPDTGICTRAATECKPGEEMVNNGGACACVPVDTPDLNQGTGIDSGTNERPPTPKPKEEGCATVPGDIQNHTNLLAIGILVAGLNRLRRKTAA
jgi:hypothetical protein